MQVSTFYEKLNKVDGNIYVVEEEIHLTNGVYEAELQHDNINEATFAVFTGPKLTGTRLETYTLSTPSLAPWKRIVRVYADVPVAYISYETDGDTVEGDDINRVQAAVVETQKALNTEEARALSAEMELNGRIDTEVKRAEDAELTLRNDLTAEVTRAKATEKTNADNLATESTRAKAAEKTLTNNLASEITRAKAAEKSIGDAVNTHISNKSNPHGVTKSQVGLGSVPNVATNDQVPTFTQATTLDNLTSGEKLTVMLGKIAKAIEDFITHKADAVQHITATERTNWNDANSKKHSHSNKSILDTVTQAMLDKLAGIAEGANKYVHPTTSGNKHIPSGGTSGQILRWSADGTAAWGADNNTIYSDMKGATASAAGVHGLVPAPAAGKQEQFLRGDGVWAAPPSASYTHPSSGVSAGTYRSVTVNAQGHVTAGTNPTTLAGYGITDAAAKNHNHDITYLKKGAVTWNDLKGV